MINTMNDIIENILKDHCIKDGSPANFQLFVDEKLNDSNPTDLLIVYQAYDVNTILAIVVPKA